MRAAHRRASTLSAHCGLAAGSSLFLLGLANLETEVDEIYGRAIRDTHRDQKVPKQNRYTADTACCSIDNESLWQATGIEEQEIFISIGCQ